MVSKESNLEQELIKKLKRKNIDYNEIEKFLKTNIIDLDFIDNNGYNCLHYAIKSENSDVVNLFLSPNECMTLAANPNTETKDSKKDIYLSPLHYAMQEVTDPSKIIKILIKNNADISKTDSFDCNIAHRIAEKGIVELLDYVLRKKLDTIINSTSKFYGGILHIAVQSDQQDIVEYILKNHSNDIDLLTRDNAGNNVLLLSIISKNFNTFKFILDWIIDNVCYDNDKKKKMLNDTNDEGNTILHELAYSKSSVLVNFMLNKVDKEITTIAETTNKQSFTYKNIQENIINLTKEKEAAEKQRKLQQAEAKKLIMEEKRKIKDELLLEEKKEQEKVEKQKELSEWFVNHRAKFFIGFFILFMIVLFLGINAASKKKKKSVIIL